MLTKNFYVSVSYNKNKNQLLGYISSIINGLNIYQLPLLQSIVLSFRFLTKDRFVILAYYSLFKHFFNVTPELILIKNKRTKVSTPKFLCFCLTRRKMTYFFFQVVFPYIWGKVEERKTYTSVPTYRGQCLNFSFNNFFFLPELLDLLLLYKNEGLFLGNFEKLTCRFMFLSKINLWNMSYLNFVLASPHPSVFASLDDEDNE